MPEPEDRDPDVQRRVVYETVSTSSTRGTRAAFILVAVVAIALLVWIWMQMR